MTKHGKKSDHLQLVDAPKTTIVEIPLPLLGALGNIEHSFFDLCIDAGQQVLATMMEQDREDLCGPRWKRNPDRKAGRAGTTQSEVTLGGRRIAIARSRVRSQAGHEMELPSFAFAANRDPLDQHTLKAVACGVLTRKYARSLDSLPEEIEERAVSKSSVSRRYVAMTTKQMTTGLTTPLGDRHFPIVMIDGIHLGDHRVLIALGIGLKPAPNSSNAAMRPLTANSPLDGARVRHSICNSATASISQSRFAPRCPGSVRAECPRPARGRPSTDHAATRAPRSSA
jgi:hypothetical protein